MFGQQQESRKYSMHTQIRIVCGRTPTYATWISAKLNWTNTVISIPKKNIKTTFSILDQKRAETVRILQERCGFPSDKDFINALECNSIEGVDFGRRDVKIANEIYGYSKGAAVGRFKHPRKRVKMDRTTGDEAAPLPPKILEHYKNIHLDIDILYVN